MTEKTALQKIAFFNELIGNPKGTFSCLSQQFEMIREEFEELEKALVAYDMAIQRCHEHGNDGGDIADADAAYLEVRDGIADVIVTTGGLAHRMGIDADADLELVYQSNMSKFILTENEAEVWPFIMELTERLAIDCTASETAPGIWAITSSSDQVGKDGKAYPKGKLLKPSTYKEPVFK